LINVAFSLTNFGHSASVNFYIKNATAGYPLLAVPAAPFTVLTTNASGTLLGFFAVTPLTPGSYSIVANETSGSYNATATFVVTPTVPVIPEFPPVALLASLVVLSVVAVLGTQRQKTRRRTFTFKT
jgi:hypothetical protein